MNLTNKNKFGKIAWCYSSDYEAAETKYRNL